MQPRWFAVVFLLLCGAACTFAFDANWKISSERAGQLDAIVQHNKDRRSAARVLSALIYTCVAATMPVLSLMLGVLLAWLWRPFHKCWRMKSAPPAATLIRGHTIIWTFIIVFLSFTISIIAGLMGWMIINLLMVVAIIGISITTCLARPQDPVMAAGRVAVSSKSNSGTQPDLEHESAETKEADDANWSQHPLGVGRSQKRTLLLCVLMFVLLCIICLVIWNVWKVDEYQLWDLNNGNTTEEFIPQLTAKTLQMLYAWDNFATNIRLQIYTMLLTSNCGSSFTNELADADKHGKIFLPWIDQYKINMDLYTPRDYTQYKSVNDWFIRRINTTFRPVTAVVYNMEIVSPADCRMLIYPNLDEARIWIKGADFTILELLDNNRELNNIFKGGEIVIARLAPQDYHRFNTPVEGNITYYKEVPGDYWSVNPLAVNSRNYVFYNLRKIVVIDTQAFGRVGYIAIGATCVGSVQLTWPDPVGHVVHLGMELGYMQFGGSTVVLLFEPNVTTWHPEILQMSAKPVESYVHVNQGIGKFKPKP
uniref:Phosphatidylserine decarboxylase n=1 Tax=Eutreptiella gymnastica TaxID=73025 RepID=A0A7S4LID6_9EUGL